MDIYYLRYEASPGQDSEKSQTVGGAYINCWVKAQTSDEARAVAIGEIQAQGWVVLSVEDGPRIESKPANDIKEYFEQAETDGACYVFHTWPIGDHSEESLH